MWTRRGWCTVGAPIAVTAVLSSVWVTGALLGGLNLQAAQPNLPYTHRVEASGTELAKPLVTHMSARTAASPCWLGGRCRIHECVAGAGARGMVGCTQAKTWSARERLPNWSSETACLRQAATDSAVRPGLRRQPKGTARITAFSCSHHGQPSTDDFANKSKAAVNVADCARGCKSPRKWEEVFLQRFRQRHIASVQECCIDQRGQRGEYHSSGRHHGSVTARRFRSWHRRRF